MPRLLIVALFLAACGADGAPEPPAAADAPASGVTLSGEARAGVVIRP